MKPEIVFSDVDGTLLTSKHKMLKGTLHAIHCLKMENIPFVIVSARSPSGIYSILKEYSLSCPIVSYSGALIMDENGNILYSAGFDKKTANDIISFIEDRKFDCSWNIYSGDNWLVKNEKDPRIRLEENIVKVKAAEGSINSLPENAQINKILCICNPEHTIEIENAIKEKFKTLSVAKSSDTMIEIMAAGIIKSAAVKEMCGLWDIPLEKAAAFGDNYNDVSMLEEVGFPFLMGNAPEELKSHFNNITDSNDSEGIYKALLKMGVIRKIGE